MKYFKSHFWYHKNQRNGIFLLTILILIIQSIIFFGTFSLNHDIDKWHTWKLSIIEEVKKVDYAFVDATFLNQKEVKRAMTEVPHPFIQETISLFKNQSFATKNKVIFIHFNHTNPTLQEENK